MMKSTVFITGGTTGLGWELAKKFAENNYQVGICGRDSSKFQGHPKISFYQADVANLAEIKSAIEDFSSTNGSLDLVVANAGIAYAHKTKIPDFKYSRKMVDINVYGVLNTFEVALEIMLKQKAGHLAAVSSVAGLNGLPGVSFYAASKSFVYKLCESFAVDLKKFGITTTCIVPGFVDTPLTQKNPHPMPFKISAEKAAEIVFQGLIKKKAIIGFPAFWFFITTFLSILPRNCYRKLMTVKLFNFSKET